MRASKATLALCMQISPRALLALAVSSDGRFLAGGGGDRGIHVWDLRTREHVHCFTGHKDAVSGVAFRDGTHEIYSTSFDRQAHLCIPISIFFSILLPPLLVIMLIVPFEHDLGDYSAFDLAFCDVTPKPQCLLRQTNALLVVRIPLPLTWPSVMSHQNHNAPFDRQMPSLLSRFHCPPADHFCVWHGHEYWHPWNL